MRVVVLPSGSWVRPVLQKVACEGLRYTCHEIFIQNKNDFYTSPSWVVGLLLDKRDKVHRLGEDVGLRPRVGDVPLRVQLLRDRHHSLGREVQLLRTQLFQLLS